ncbi:sensor histidine kinase [Anaerotignum sp. MB30-C6]|uniref:sensor histidine kinase n=1 Tax=Anaerotignum sp. MB30-C6 TaxID=3070814 RepID=UPI0027DD0E01|nr:sensor histidine kinase KdpD [Anaerotignum sp. MB30-C6]WMI79789.1 sensor histidine kinase KdpD [Anaerotignum sp. MB30-C6]
MEEATSIPRRGHLKIFFGYAAGVGKTYAMLKAAHGAKRRGVDVVVGYVESHERAETTVLLNGLEQLEVKPMEYKGLSLKEFDIDLALARKPKLILVDELAHTNVQGSRHAKRYQDIDELLRNGIDVYTTVNVQHIESLNDIVVSITGIVVRERIPDFVFDNASQVELVDIEPYELINRLKEGKIYKEKQAQKALSSFFDIKNLTALREIALRRCADRVNIISEKIRVQGKSEYYTDEHILVCLSSSPTNAKIIRTAARMCNAFKGTFTALFVETSVFPLMSNENKERLRKNIHLAEQLGATVETAQGDDVAYQISEFARLSGVSKIVLGRNNATRKYFWSKPTLTEKLTEIAPNLDIYIIPDKQTPPYKSQRPKNSSKVHLYDMVKAVLLLAAATIIGFFFYHLAFSEANMIMAYILSVLLISVFTNHRLYSLFSSVVSVLLFNYFFTAPRFTLNATDAGYPVTFVIMFIAAFITSTLATKLKQQAKQSAQTAYRTKILLETNQLLQKTESKEKIIEVTCKQLSKLIEKDIVFHPVSDGDLGKPITFFDRVSDDENYLLQNELAVAKWVLKNNKHAGATTNTLSSAKCYYLAVRMNEIVYGVVGIALEDHPLQSFEHSIMLSMLGECALALENQRANKERENAAVLAKNEQLRANLLRSISHDLRTPLTSISGNANVLIVSENVMAVERKQQIYLDIYDDSMWLINLVENLLSVTKIEDGSMKLGCTTELVEDVVVEALKHVNRKKNEHHIVFEKSDEVLLAKMDGRLIIQVLINIVDNAIKYTPKGSEIKITAKKANGFVILEIADNGDGISDEEKSRIFDMFYTVNTKIVDSHRSMGLGLALCKSIIAAHGGEIKVMDNKPKGAVFHFTIPYEEVLQSE